MVVWRQSNSSLTLVLFFRSAGYQWSAVLNLLARYITPAALSEEMKETMCMSYASPLLLLHKDFFFEILIRVSNVYAMFSVMKINSNVYALILLTRSISNLHVLCTRVRMRYNTSSNFKSCLFIHNSWVTRWKSRWRVERTHYRSRWRSDLNQIFTRALIFMRSSSDLHQTLKYLYTGI